MTENKVYILLTDTGSFFTKLIKLYTRKPYNHASISFDSKLSEVYSFGRKKVKNPFVGGFVKENVKQGLFKHADCAIYSIKVTDIERKKMKQWIEEIEIQQESYRYNFLGLFGFLVNKPIKREKAYFCSQFVATVLKESDIMNFTKPLGLTAPSDFATFPELELEYEGRLVNYYSERNENEWDQSFAFIPAAEI